MADLLQTEYVLVAVVLQLLVRIVDAELLKAVRLEVLKSEYVQNAYGQTLHTTQDTEPLSQQSEHHLHEHSAQHYFTTQNHPNT